MPEICVDRTRIDEAVEAHPARRVFELYTEREIDVWMGEHAPEHGLETIARHRLKPIGEIAIVAVRAHGDATANARIEFAGVDAPLLAGIVREQQLVELATDPRDDRVFGVPDPRHALAALFEERCRLRRVEFEAVELRDGARAERQRDVAFADASEHAMLVR